MPLSVAMKERGSHCDEVAAVSYTRNEKDAC